MPVVHARTVAAHLIAVAALAACVSLPPNASRIIVTLREGIELRDPTVFEREVARRTGVRVVYGAAISERVHAIELRCDAADADCTQARAAVRSSGLFSDVSLDMKRRRE